MTDKKLTNNEPFKVGDCVVSKVCPTMIGTIVLISGECEETSIVVRVSDREILGGAEFWRKIKN